MSTSSLRERQKQLARKSILSATADEIVERGVSDFSLQAVAERAGVSTRTLYNYYPSRDDLFRQLAAWSDEHTLASGGWNDVENLEHFPDAVAAVWASWDAQGRVYQAVSRLGAADVGAVGDEMVADRRGRTEQIRGLLAELRPDLDADQLLATATLLHAVMGGAMWDRMKVLSDLPADRSGPVVAWALRVLLGALEAGDDPWH